MGYEQPRCALQTLRRCDIFFLLSRLRIMQREKIHVLLDILGAAAQRLFNCRLVLSGLLAQLKMTFFSVSTQHRFQQVLHLGYFVTFFVMDEATSQLDGAGVLTVQISQNVLQLKFYNQGF